VTIRSRSTRVVDLIHKFPYRNLGIGVTRDLESLYRELPVHETPKRSGPLDPNHRGSLDLVQELAYRSSGNGVTRGLGRCISNSQLPKSRYGQDRRSGGDSQPSISSKVRFRVSGFEESKDLTLLHR
jgi:hypothetical protein